MIPEDDYVFLSLPVAFAGPAHGLCQAISNRWWSVHPEHGLRFYNPRSERTGRHESRLGSPQCNSDRRIMERLLYAGDELMFIERVFIPVRATDWDH